MFSFKGGGVIVGVVVVVGVVAPGFPLGSGRNRVIV